MLDCASFSLGCRLPSSAKGFPSLFGCFTGTTRQSDSLLGGTCASKADRCKASSPNTYVSPEATPMLVLHGAADETFPYCHALALMEKMKAAGAAVEMFTAHGGPHTFWNSARWYDPSLAAMERFLNKHLFSK